MVGAGTQPWWLLWNADPAIVCGLLVFAGLFVFGTRKLWRHAGPGRGVRIGQALAGAAGLFTVAIALLSPLDRLAEYLFWVHMVQHMALILLAAPLLVLSRPIVPLLWALPRGMRRRLGRFWMRRNSVRAVAATLTLLPAAWLLSAATLWLWHAPALYQAALMDSATHALEHATFLGTAVLFWWAALDPHGGRRRYGASVLAIVTMGVQNGVLGALITFSSLPWYGVYASRSVAWGLAPLEDQQLAGLVMWVPAGVVYLGAAAALFISWLAAFERSQPGEQDAPAAGGVASGRSRIDAVM